MKTDNPFNPYLENDFIGRKEEQSYFRTLLVSLQNPQIVNVFGGIGNGRSALIRKFDEIAHSNGVKTIVIRCQKNEDALERAIVETNTTVEETIKTRDNTILFLDDFDRIKGFDRAVERISQIYETKKAKACIVVVTKTKIEKIGQSFIEVRNFDEHDTREYVQKSMHEQQLRIGEEFLSTIYNDSNGNVRAIKMICGHAFDVAKESDKVITKAQYLVYLPSLMNRLDSEWFGELYSQTPDAERAILRIISKEDNGIHVSDISKKLGKPIGQVTVLIARLVKRGQILKIDRGKYRVFCRLYGRFVLQR